jgi:hypothetical protein
MFAEKLIPKWTQSEFAAVRSLLESGLPTARNRSAGHGQGSAVRQVPDYLAALALHMAATNMVLLVEAVNGLPPQGTASRWAQPAARPGSHLGRYLSMQRRQSPEARRFRATEGLGAGRRRRSGLGATLADIPAAVAVLCAELISISDGQFKQ